MTEVDLANVTVIVHLTNHSNNRVLDNPELVYNAGRTC